MKTRPYLTFALAFGLVAVIATTTQATPIIATATLDASQEVSPPGSTSTALGAAVLTVEPTTGEFDFSLEVTGIDPSDLADLQLGPDISSVHLHSAPAGSNGPVVVDLGGGNTNTNVTSFGNGGFSLNIDGGFFGGLLGNTLADSNTNLADLILGNLYINVHTNDFLAGAIRGQLSIVQQPGPAVPEPSSLACLSLGCIGFLATSRRKRR